MKSVMISNYLVKEKKGGKKEERVKTCPQNEKYPV